MAHMFESGVFYGQVPWHGLGVTLPEDHDARHSVDETIKYSKLDWTVEKRQLFLQGGSEVESHKAVVRSSDNSVLGVVGNRYEVLQNIDQFKWFQPFLDSKECCFETAGSLKNGKVVWVLAKLNRENTVIVPDTPDEVKKYLVLSTSHDGSLTTRVTLTPIRVVCNNTLSLMIGSSASETLRVRHTKSQMDALNQIREIVDTTNQKFEATAEQYRKLARHKISRQDMIKYIHKAMGFEDDMSTRTQNTLKQLIGFADNGLGQQYAKGTLWGAYNAITQFISHDASRNNDNRLYSAWFGTNATLSNRALSLALEIAV